MYVKRFITPILVSLVLTATADVLVLKNGDVIQGRVLQTNETGILFQCDYTTVTYPLRMVKQVQEEARVADRLASSAYTNNLPPWGGAIMKLAKAPWAHDLRQIPATVIDKGVLKNVPYMSFRCGVDYEVNIYGDPDNPAGIEIGVYRSLLQDDQAKSNCLAFVQTLMPSEHDKAQVSAALAKQGIITEGEMDYEITLPSQEDSYNGWWISVYNRKSIDRARATDAELEQIAIAKAAAVQQKIWTTQQMAAARPDPDSLSFPADAGGGSPTHGDRVFVRGYTRSNGTYVAPYTRSYPSHHR
jgi:hypothetical protein